MPCTTVIAHTYNQLAKLSHLFNTNIVTTKLKTSHNPCSINKFYTCHSRTMKDNSRPPGSLWDNSNRVMYTLDHNVSQKLHISFTDSML